jgi:nardilysin
VSFYSLKAPEISLKLFLLADFPFKYAQYWNERWIRKEFSLPLKNRFICKNFEIISDHEEHRLDYPLMIFKNKFCKCFFRTDDKFNLPFGFVYVQLKSSITESSVTHLNMTSIFSMCVKNFLSEKLYPAVAAGYSYKLNSTDDGLVLKLSGFSEKLPMLLDLITKAIKNTDEVVEKPIFDFFKKELKKNCYNFIINSMLFNE